MPLNYYPCLPLSFSLLSYTYTQSLTLTHTLHPNSLSHNHTTPHTLTLSLSLSLFQLKQSMGFALKPLCGSYDGYYRLNLGLESSQICLRCLMEINETLRLVKCRDIFVFFAVCFIFIFIFFPFFDIFVYLNLQYFFFNILHFFFTLMISYIHFKS